MCKATNQLIVNGRWPGDGGNFTCMTHNGTSVVDYLITHRSNFDLLDNFSVGEFQPFSNHAPLSFSLKANTVCRNVNENVKPKYYKFDNKYKEVFTTDITTNLDSLVYDLNIEISGNGDVKCLTSIFTNFLCKNGNKYFERTCGTRKSCFQEGNNSKSGLTMNAIINITYINKRLKNLPIH